MQRLTRLTIAITMLAGLASFAPAPVHAQGMLDRMKKKAEEAAKRKAEQRADKRAGEATDAALNKAECAASDQLCQEKAAATAAVSQPGRAGVGGAASSLKPGEGAWRNYDFVPGDRVIFAEDFTRDEVGAFPKRLTFKSGNFEVVDWAGSRYLSTSTFDSKFTLPLPETLPERFTLEFDYSADGGNGMQIYFVDPAKGEAKAYVDMGTWMGGVRGGGVQAIGKPANEFGYKDAVFPVRVMADGRYVKVYMGETRVANVPTADLGRSRAIWFTVPGAQNRAAMIGNLRIAAGGKKLYDAIAASGRVATQGILFDVASDRLRPESTPTLKEISAMLNDHAELELVIEGHTDNAGDAAGNQTLSAQRAAAVKAYLVSQGIGEERLQTKGLGASKPAANNGTAEGRAQNRRVELVKSTGTVGAASGSAAPRSARSVAAASVSETPSVAAPGAAPDGRATVDTTYRLTAERLKHWTSTTKALATVARRYLPDRPYSPAYEGVHWLHLGSLLSVPALDFNALRDGPEDEADFRKDSSNAVRAYRAAMQAMRAGGMSREEYATFDAARRKAQELEMFMAGGLQEIMAEAPNADPKMQAALKNGSAKLKRESPAVVRENHTFLQQHDAQFTAVSRDLSAIWGW